MIVGLAARGDRDAFGELVRRRQGWIRSLMRHFSGDQVLADDLAQQVFLLAWRDIGRLREPRKFAGWLKRLAVNVWRQYLRKHDVLLEADVMEEELIAPRAEDPGVAMDLDRALLAVPPLVRLCVVLAHYEGMTHGEIAKAAGLPLGTVKSHVRRGGQRLQAQLAAYSDSENSYE